MKIYVDNSYTACFDVPDNAVTILYNSLFFYSPGFRYSRLYKRGLWNGKVHLYNKKSHSFPTGLLNKVLKILDKISIQYQLKDLREKPNNTIKLNRLRSLPKLRDYQAQALEAMKKHDRGIIDMPTGSGKTRVALEAILKKKVSTLFITPTVNIALQTYKRFREILGRKNVGIIYGQKKEFDKPITIACIASLAHNKKLKNPVPKEFYKKINMLIIDEFHHSGAKTYVDLNKTDFQDIYYKYGLTATFLRSDGTEMQMHGVLSDVLFKMTPKEAIDSGYLVKPKFYFQHVDIIGNKYNKFNDSYKNGIVLNNERNQLIIDAAKKYKDKHTLIFVREIEHGEYLSKKIPNSVFISGRESGTTNVKIIKNFERKKFTTLIATSVIGEGSDICPIEVIINAQGMKAEGFILQRIGRGMRLSPKTGKEDLTVIDFFDKDGHFLERHSEQRKKIYLKHLTDTIND